MIAVIVEELAIHEAYVLCCQHTYVGWASVAGHDATNLHERTNVH